MSRMAKNKGNVPAWQIDNLFKERGIEQSPATEIPISDSGTIKIKVKSYISMMDYEALISDVSSNVFEFSDSLKVEYHPERLPFALWKGLTKYYTNIDTEMSDERLYKLYLVEDWESIFQSVICATQYRDILRSVQKAIQHKVNEMLCEEKQELLHVISQIESMGCLLYTSRCV